ncbi:MAG: PAS domain-containing protein [Deltaproteobacteria bacterium]|nr:PAS domain-containing protein [Deltaproteobacteria bacterium]
MLTCSFVIEEQRQPRTETTSASRDAAHREHSWDDRRRIEVALDSAELGVWEWIIAEDRVVWSPAVERIHGIAPGTFDGTRATQSKDLHPEDREQVELHLHRTLTERAPLRMTYRIIRPDQSIRWLEANAQVVLDERGQPERLIGIVRDVTDRRESEGARVRLLASEVARADAERQRERLSGIFEGITDAFIVIDDELRVVQANRAAAQLARCDQDSLIGRNVAELPMLRGPSIERIIARATKTRESGLAEDHIAELDRWFESNVFPLAEGISIYTRDVTMRKRAVELTSRLARHSVLRADVAVVLSEQRELRPMLERCCQAIVTNLNVAFARLWTVDESGTTLLLQASAGMYTHIDGPHKAVPIGSFKIGLIASEREPHLTNDVLNDPRVGNPEWARKEKMVAFAGYPLLVDGELVGVLAMFSRQVMHEDTMSALGGIADTIAQGIERRRAETELDQRLEELARSNADLEQFAYVASHDLQEPLRMIASYNQLLSRRYKGKLDPEADEFIGFTVEGVTRMQRLINDLLSYSRLGRGTKQHAKVELQEVFAEATANLTNAIETGNASVTHDPLPPVIGDRGQLVQLLQNLIGNAIKFHGDEPPKIHVIAQSDGAAWKLGVRDNGIGIDPQYFERIFVIFQRLHAREDYPGTGIGLAICKKIVERHGGRIWVESAPKAGSTIWFTLARRS